MLGLNWTSRTKASNLLYGRSRSIRKYTTRRLVNHTIPRRIHRLPMEYPSHLRQGLEHTRSHASPTPRYRQLSRTSHFRRQKHKLRLSMSDLIPLASHRPRFGPRATQRWTSTKTRVLGRVHRKRGIVRVSARKSVLETVSANEKGIENATETETETGSRGEMGQEVGEVGAAEIVGSTIHTRVEIGRWQKEWDFELFFLSFLTLTSCLDGTPV